MDANDRTHKLLEEIRDAQREHLAEYRSVTREAVELQRRTAARQDQLRLVYRRVLLVGGVLVTALLGLLLYLLVRWSHLLFR